MFLYIDTKYRMNSIHILLTFNIMLKSPSILQWIGDLFLQNNIIKLIAMYPVFSI